MRKLILSTLTIMIAMAARPGLANEVNIAVGRSLPPYVIAENWSGLEYDIVKAALAVEGHTAKPHLMALARVSKELEAGLVDAAMTQRPGSSIFAYSAPYITYRNFAITLARRNLHIDSLEDLRDKSVSAFQKASLSLGPQFAAAVANNSRYREEAKQAVQPMLLYLDRVDVVIADRNIFAWYTHDPEVAGRVDTSQPVRFHPLFLPTDYHVAFRDEMLRDSFDRGLKKIRDNGDYERIVQGYSRYLAEDDGVRR